MEMDEDVYDIPLSYRFAEQGETSYSYLLAYTSPVHIYIYILIYHYVYGDPNILYFVCNPFQIQKRASTMCQALLC